MKESGKLDQNTVDCCPLQEPNSATRVTDRTTSRIIALGEGYHLQSRKNGWAINRGKTLLILSTCFSANVCTIQ